MAVSGPIIAAVAGAVVSSALAPKPAAPQEAAAPVAAPTVAPVTTMPTVDDSAVQEEKKRSIADQLARQGRASTILTGGDSGGSSTLG